MISERTLVSFDWAAKSLLRQKANFDILEGFLSEALNEAIKVISILESESNKTDEADKYNQVDILCENSKKELIIIEIQFFDEPDYFHRLVYGTSKAITDYMHSGYTYDKVKKVYSINIIYFDLGMGQGYIYRGKMEFKGMNTNDDLELSYAQKEKFGKRYPGDIFPEILLVKVNNFEDIIKSSLDQWIYFFKHSELPENYSAQGLTQVSKKLNLLKMDTTTQNEYIDYLKNVRLSEKILDDVKEEHFYRGKQIGIQKEKIEVVLTLHDDKIPTERIAKYTKLSESEVMEILKEHGAL